MSGTGDEAFEELQRVLVLPRTLLALEHDADLGQQRDPRQANHAKDERSPVLETEPLRILERGFEIRPLFRRQVARAQPLDRHLRRVGFFFRRRHGYSSHLPSLSCSGYISKT